VTQSGRLVSELTIVNFGNDLEIGPPEGLARLVAFNLAQERAGRGFRPPKLIELAIADRFIRALRATGVEATIAEDESATAEGTGDFVYRVGPANTEHRVEVVRHVDGKRLAAQAARQRAIVQLKREYPECVAPFVGYNLRLNDDMPESTLRSSIPDIPKSLAAFSEVTCEVPDNTMRPRRWRHSSGAVLSAAVSRTSSGTALLGWGKLPAAVLTSVHELRIANTVSKKLEMRYDKPLSAAFELLVWTTNDVVLGWPTPPQCVRSKL
jgi:hypothetical protein